MDKIIKWIISIFKKKTKDVSFFPGALESPRDDKDYMLSGMQTPIEFRELPETYMIPYKLRISYQNGFPYCGGYAGATLKEEKERREHYPIDFDGDWLYKEAKKIDGYDGAGTYFRCILKVLQKTGAKPLGYNDYCAENYKVGSYAIVDDISFAGIKSAIYQNGVVVALLRGSNSAWSTAYIKQPQEPTWGHFVACIGWNKDNIVFQNSWGENWGDKGLGYFNPDIYKPIEVWAVLTDLPTPEEILLEKPKYLFYTNIQLGDNNVEVIHLQECLRYLGLFPATQKITGYFGPTTLASVKEFQIKNNISPVSGFVGNLTRAELNKQFN